VAIAGFLKLQSRSRISFSQQKMIQNLMNTIENQQVKSNEPMTTWAHGWRESTQWPGGTRLHPLKSQKNCTSNPQMKEKSLNKMRFNSRIGDRAQGS
jgi:hypothetical protein